MRWLMSLLLALVFSVESSSAQSDIYWQKIADGFTFVTAIVQPPQDTSRLFIADLSGTISIIQDGQKLDQPFLDLTESINTTSYGQGLIGMAFHPHYAENGYLFVVYTDADNWVVLARYQVSEENANLVDTDSAQIILRADHASELHNGGDIAFGPNGYLYWAIGDGAYKRSPAPKLSSHLGGILRLDIDSNIPYAIPADNPYLGVENALPELWAKGLRNPWRISFDQLTGDFYIADVGEYQIEEVNFQPADSVGGQNYGWNQFEGTWLYYGGARAGLTFPVVEYQHDNGSCSITGGYVYRGSILPALAGKYVFSDYCSGILWSTYQEANGVWYTEQWADSPFHVTTFGQDNAGELYLGDSLKGEVYQLTPPLTTNLYPPLRIASTPR